MIRKAAQARDHDRIKAAIGVFGLHALLGYALITAFAIEIPATVRDELKLFDIRPDPPPSPSQKPAPHRTRSNKPKAAPSPPNLKAKPSPIVAPLPETRLIVPTPVIAAPIPGFGSNPTAGAADVPGPGTGSGGQGTGSGGGGNGDGDDFTPPQWLRGRLKHSDYPRAAGEVGIGRTITVRFTVQTNGRVSECTVLQSSGNPILDDATCRVIERRYRYEPSRDANGTAVLSAVVEEHTWEAEDR